MSWIEAQGRKDGLHFFQLQSHDAVKARMLCDLLRQRLGISDYDDDEGWAKWMVVLTPKVWLPEGKRNPKKSN